MRRSIFILLSLFLALHSVPKSYAEVTIDMDQTTPVLLGTDYTGGGTATIVSGVTVETSGTVPPYAVEVIELAPTDSWSIYNYGTVIANSDDSVHCYTDAAVNNYGTIASRGGGGSGVAAVFSDDSIGMDLVNAATGLIQGDGVGVLFDFYGTGNTGSIDNQGTIEGGTTGVAAAGGDTTLTNSGTITGLDGPGVVMGGVFDPATNSYTVINSGTIVGNDSGNVTVSMGEGDDVVELQTGTQIVNGDIDGGGNNISGDTLILNGSGNVSWNNYSFEILEKTGSGRWTLETDLDLGAGGIADITTGDLSLNANLNSPSGMTVYASGTLSGSGFVTGSVTNNGKISPGSGSASPFGILDVTGDVAFGAGSNMAVDIGALGTGDLLAVSGNVTFAGTTDSIQVSEITAIADGEIIDVITAGAPLGTSFGSLQQEASLVVTFSQAVAVNNLGILTNRSPYSDYTATDNQKQVAEALYDSVGLSAGDLGRVLAHLDFLPLNDLQNAFEELQPKPYATHPGLILRDADFVRSNLSGRMRDRRQETNGTSRETRSNDSNSSVSPASYLSGLLDSTTDVSQPVSLSTEQSKWRIYAQSYIRWMDEKTDTSIDPAAAFTFGTFFGADGRFGQRSIGGFCLGTGVTDIENSGGSGNKLALRFGPYFSYFWDRFILEGSLTGSVNWFSNQRSIDITGLTRSAQGAYDSYDLAAELAALYELECRGFTFAPELRLAYDYTYLDNFQETGADSISLIVFERRLHSLNHTMGGRLGYDIKFAKSFLRPEAWIAWVHRYFNDEQAVQAAFTGAPQNDFTVSAPKTQLDILHWGAGLTLSLGGAVNIHLRYQAEVYPDTWNHCIQGGFLFQL